MYSREKEEEEEEEEEEDSCEGYNNGNMAKCYLDVIAHGMSETKRGKVYRIVSAIGGTALFNCTWNHTG